MKYWKSFSCIIFICALVVTIILGIKLISSMKAYLDESKPQATSIPTEEDNKYAKTSVTIYLKEITPSYYKENPVTNIQYWIYVTDGNIRERWRVTEEEYSNLDTGTSLEAYRLAYRNGKTHIYELQPHRGNGLWQTESNGNLIEQVII